MKIKKVYNKKGQILSYTDGVNWYKYNYSLDGKELGYVDSSGASRGNMESDIPRTQKALRFIASFVLTAFIYALLLFSIAALVGADNTYVYFANPIAMTLVMYLGTSFIEEIL